MYKDDMLLTNERKKNFCEWLATRGMRSNNFRLQFPIISSQMTLLGWPLDEEAITAIFTLLPFRFLWFPACGMVIGLV
ncbi:MAG: hypothetical protein ABIN36_19425 [Ferruginibacter sp.]